ncbi:MAG: DUF2809 domain-containing protein [Oscillospiraceae bacterium]|nr:DUF2809 domain-containing protein [Oscillospiraceae bacterium]
MIALFVHDSFIRPYLGDMLVTVLLCCLLRCLFPRRPKLLALWVFLFSAAVEFSQLLGLADRLGIRSGALQTILGATFDWKDIFCYLCGCILFFLAEKALLKRKIKNKGAAL